MHRSVPMRFITTSRQAFNALRHLSPLEVEEFWVITLHANKKVIRQERVFRGTVDACPVFPRDVFRSAIRQNASSIIVAHNHPSGDCQPSRTDHVVTEHLYRAGELLGIPLDDHLIIGDRRYWSFADAGQLKVTERRQADASHSRL